MEEIKVSTELVFDIDIENVVRKLLKFGFEEYPNRNWLVDATFWDDGDYVVKLVSSWGGKKDVYEYRKSESKYVRYTTAGGKLTAQKISNVRTLK